MSILGRCLPGRFEPARPSTPRTGVSWPWRGPRLRGRTGAFPGIRPWGAVSGRAVGEGPSDAARSLDLRP